jgi:hypothetical protein
MSGHPAAALFIADARMREHDTIAVVGTAKHAGKTTAVAALTAAARDAGEVVGLFSLGRDGETRDAFDDREKPSVVLRAGMLAFIPRSNLRPGLPVALCALPDLTNALGDLVAIRALAEMSCEISGPPSGSGVATAREVLRSCGATTILIDGALDRMAPLASLDPAFVFATGVARGGDVAAIAAQLGGLTERMQLRAPSKDEEVVVVEGVLDSAMLEELLLHSPAGVLLVEDPLRMTHDAFLAARRARTIRSRKQYAVLGSCINAYTPSRSCDPDRLLQAVAQATHLPVIDCLAGTIATDA